VSNEHHNQMSVLMTRVITRLQCNTTNNKQIITSSSVRTSSFSSALNPVTNSCRGRRSTARLASTPRLSGPVTRPLGANPDGLVSSPAFGVTNTDGLDELGPRRPSDAASRFRAATRCRSWVVSELSLADISSSSESKIFFCVDAAA